MPKLPGIQEWFSAHLQAGSPRKAFIVRAATLMAALGVATILSFLASSLVGRSPSPEEPTGAAGNTATEEADGDNGSSTTTGGDALGQEHTFSEEQLETLFGSPTKIRQEAETLIGDMDRAIEEMDELLSTAEAVDLESCDLHQIYLEIDLLVLANQKGELAWRSAAFLAAVEQDVLGPEFNLAIDQGVLGKDFDHTEIDANVLEEDFDAQASEAGRELKETIIQLRQRSKKIASQTHRLGAIDSWYESLHPDCSLVH